MAFFKKNFKIKLKIFFLFMISLILGYFSTSFPVVAKEKGPGKAFRPFIPFEKISRSGIFNNLTQLHRLALDLSAFKGNEKNVRVQNYRSPMGKKEFTFTFDLGDKKGHLDHILAVLEKYQIKATFFITGKFLLKYPDYTKKIVSQGHEIANHTFNHRFMKSEQELAQELLMTELVFYKVTGRIIAPYWRAPYFQEDSSKKSWLLSKAAKLGYRHFNVTVDSKDWTNKKHTCYISGQDFLWGFQRLDLNRLGNNPRFDFCKRNLKYLKNNQKFNVDGGIILMHSTSMRKSDYLIKQMEPMVLFLKKKGYKIVTLTELFNDR